MRAIHKPACGMGFVVIHSRNGPEAVKFLTKRRKNFLGALQRIAWLLLAVTVKIEKKDRLSICVERISYPSAHGPHNELRCQTRSPIEIRVPLPVEILQRRVVSRYPVEQAVRIHHGNHMKDKSRPNPPGIRLSGLSEIRNRASPSARNPAASSPACCWAMMSACFLLSGSAALAISIR